MSGLTPVLGFNGTGFDVRINNSVVKKSPPVQASKPVNVELFNNKSEFGDTVVRILKSNDGYHLVVRDSNITKEHIQRLFIQVQSALSRNNVRLSSVTANGEELWRAHNQVELTDAVCFDRQY